ncbi:hypothetical protein GCM10023238_02720 [Streptomyces heliomycini]
MALPAGAGGAAADVPSLGEAERELAEALREATEVLTRLDVAGSGPVAEAAIDAYRARAWPRGGGRCWRRGIRLGRCGCWSWLSGWGTLVSLAGGGGTGVR